MRQWMNLFENLTTDQIAKYVMDNDHTVIDHKAAYDALVDAGYRNTHRGGRYFRAINHTARTNSAIADMTIEQAHHYLLKNPSFEKKGPQSCCSTIEDALQFVGATIHLAHYDFKKWPEHRPETMVARPLGLWVVYELEIPQTGILWAMDDLKRFLKNHPEWETPALSVAIAEYGWQDEIIVNTDLATIIDVHLYDSEDDEAEYNR